METFAEFTARIEHPQHRERMETVLNWVAEKYPQLVPKIAWNQPMFTDHETFIIGFSVAKHHIAAAPERATMIHFADQLAQAGVDRTDQLIRFKWDKPVDYDLLAQLIEFNIEDKADCKTFWRK
ncbi:intracellular iron chaperone frataxin [Paenibacillus sp. CCS19]|uniref:iron chaperone n=1 Tax=Paenibacillus sp. CCS19 TaxID=3158387 RepID=UPI00256698C1|nr:iron chaperone [Paenibacillus cellulosilyticus]GMK40825.1 intracellular iron chaperone frataxin [Paenibacillus cellulosilyticus]